jgi:hypothetical protein
MKGRRSAIHIAVDEQTRETFRGWRREQTTPVALAKRARAVLLAADGHRVYPSSGPTRDGAGCG